MFVSVLLDGDKVLCAGRVLSEVVGLTLKVLGGAIDGEGVEKSVRSCEVSKTDGEELMVEERSPTSFILSS